MSGDSSSSFHQPLFIWIPFSAKKSSEPAIVCLGNPAFSFFLALSQMVVIHFLKIQSIFAFATYLQGLFFSLCSCVCINWNNVVIDLALTFFWPEFKMYGAWAKNIIIPNFSSIIIPKTLKNLIAQVNFTVQILNKAGHMCGWVLRACLKAFSKCLIFSLIHG